MAELNGKKIIFSPHIHMTEGRYNYLNVGTIRFGLNQLQQGMFPLVDEYTKLAGELNGTAFEAVLMKFGETSHIFGICDGSSFIELLFDEQDNLNVTYHTF